MQIENEFVVQAPIEDVWHTLLDVERIAPCMPGAQLTEVVDDHTWKGRTSVKVGPVSLAFAGTVTLQERDDVAHRVVLQAKGMEQRGKGAASATMVATLATADAGGTRVVMSTDLTISGAIAQYGRGMIGDITQRLTDQFASCLESNMAASGAPATAAPAVEASPPPASPAPGSTPPASTPPASTPPAARPPARPMTPAASGSAVKGVRLTLWALWRALVRLVARLFGRGER